MFNILEEQYKKNLTFRATETEVLVCTIGAGLCKEKLKLSSEMWKRNLKVEIIYSEKPKPQKQMEYALENEIPFMIWLGEEEIKGGFVKIKVNLSFFCLPLLPTHFSDTLSILILFCFFSALTKKLKKSVHVKSYSKCLNKS